MVRAVDRLESWAGKKELLDVRNSNNLIWVFKRAWDAVS